METFRTNRDIVEALRGMHRHLRRFYIRRREVAEKERVRLLLDYLGRHHQRLESALADMHQQDSEGLLDTFFQYLPESLGDLYFDLDALSAPDMTVDDVIHTFVRNDEALTRLYERLAQTAQMPSVQEMFSRMKENLERERTHLAEMALHLKDI